MEDVIKQYGAMVVESIATLVVLGILMGTVLGVGPLRDMVMQVVITSC